MTLALLPAPGPAQRQTPAAAARPAAPVLPPLAPLPPPGEPLGPEGPVLTLAEALLQARKAAPDLAVAQFLPTLSLNGQYRYNNAPGFADEHFTWAVALALSIPLYDGGFRYAALREAASEQRTAAAQAKGQALRIEDELRRGQLDLQAVRGQVEQAAQALVFARENQQLIRAQFEAGTATQVEVSDAESALFQSEAALVQRRVDVHLSSLRLLRAIGAFDP
ncbi:MAG: hypothetical protein NVS4B10_10080 [Myxococcales bacterium]